MSLETVHDEAFVGRPWGCPERCGDDLHDEMIDRVAYLFLFAIYFLLHFLDSFLLSLLLYAGEIYSRLGFAGNSAFYFGGVAACF